MNRLKHSSSKDTLEDAEFYFQLTGNIGNLWTELSKTIVDSQNTMAILQSTLDKTNKTVSILDGPQKQLRLNGAMD